MLYLVCSPLLGYADDLPKELFGVELGVSLSELDDVKKTRAYQTVSFTPPKPDIRLSVYWASHDKSKKVLGVHGYKFDLQPQECNNLMGDIINTESKKHNIVFQLKKRKSGSEYYFFEHAGVALVIDCRDKGTRLRYALSKKKNG